MKYTLLLTLIAAGAMAATAHADAPSYTKDVKPFLEKYCTDCHNNVQAKARIELDSYEGLMKMSRRGAVVSPGKPDRSRVMLTLTGGAKQMPPRKYSAQPKADEIAMVKAWIADGAKNDSPDKANPPAQDPKGDKPEKKGDKAGKDEKGERGDRNKKREDDDDEKETREKKKKREKDDD
jgi:Planctomycete cytochrome C